MLRLNVLGRFEAQWSDGEPVDLTTKKAQALLAYLAVESGRPHTRDQLATLLWADTGDERARHNLRQALSKIRRCCDSLVRASGDCLAIDPEGCAVDVIEFERLAKSDDPDELRRCLDLYRGDLLEGVIPREPVYDEWLLVARGRLRKMACQAAGHLASVLREQDRIEESIETLNDLLAIDPAYEPAHRDLMELLSEGGRRSDALRQYQACVEALERELGAEPSPETKLLYASLRRSEPGTATQDIVEPATASAREGTDQPTVAVLPFENLSGEQDSYFVDGIAEDLITALSCFHSLVVIARGSSFAYRDRDLTEQAIADELSAQYLVRGSVQRADSRVRINVQLLDAVSGINVWGHRYDRELEDVFVLQDEITSTLVSTLAGRVEAARLAHARKAPPERLDAYDLLLRGKDYHHRYTAEDCRLCMEMFERAIERDPTYAVAYAWLACGLGQAMVFKLDDIPKLVDRCQLAAETGLGLDENDSECHRVLAQVNLTRGNIKRALWHQERALFLNPNDDRTVCAMGEILAFVGRAEEAEKWVRKSMRLNPYHPPRYWTHLARALFHLERYEDALGAFEHVGKARVDDLAYCVAATARLGDSNAVVRRVAELREQFPDFDPTEFANSLPYQREVYRQALLEPLTASFRRESAR
jgi:TolB-like protein/Tfp pilus assembly protein PilF